MQLIKYLSLIFILTIQSFNAISSTNTSTNKIDNAWDIPKLELKDIDGKNHSIDEWKGKVILLNYWASWCSPCIKEIKDFIKFQKHFVNNNLQIVSIGIDSKENLQKVSSEFNINYPVLIANIEQEVGKKFVSLWENPYALVPYSIVINSDGKIVYKHKGKFNTGLFDYYVRPLLNR
jgi:peroxiredoxin